MFCHTPITPSPVFSSCIDLTLDVSDMLMFGGAHMSTTVSLGLSSPSSFASRLTLSTTGAVSSRTSLPLGLPQCPSQHRPHDIFVPVPPEIQFPREQAPGGARYCAELDAFVPAERLYKIRGINKARPRITKDFGEWVRRVGFKAGIRARPTGPGRWLYYEPLVMAMGLSHAELTLVELKEARKRADIVYRPVACLEPDLSNIA